MRNIVTTSTLGNANAGERTSRLQAARRFEQGAKGQGDGEDLQALSGSARQRSRSDG